MKVFTSYYKRFTDTPTSAIPVRVSTSVPNWFPYLPVEMRELYPGWELVTAYKDGVITWEEYKLIYTEKLRVLGKDYIMDRLREISSSMDNRDICLLCYEKDSNCHRHIIAEFLDCDIVEL